MANLTCKKKILIISIILSAHVAFCQKSKKIDFTNHIFCLSSSYYKADNEHRISSFHFESKIDSIEQTLISYNKTKDIRCYIPELFKIYKHCIENAKYDLLVSSCLLLSEAYRQDFNKLDELRYLDIAVGYITFVPDPKYELNVLINKYRYWVRNNGERRHKYLVFQRIYLLYNRLDAGTVKEIVRLLLEEQESTARYWYGGALLCSSLVVVIGYNTVKRYLNNQTHYSDVELESRIKIYFEKSIESGINISLNHMAKEFNIPFFTLDKMIRSSYRMSFNEVYNEFRVNKAKSLLLDPEIVAKYAMDTIGKMAGFESRSTFYMQFKKQTKTSPKQYVLTKYS